MSVTIVHARTAGGLFLHDGGMVVHHAETDADADAYFRTELEMAVRQRAEAALEFYRRRLERVAQTASLATAGPVRLPANGATGSGVVAVLRDLAPDDIGGLADPCSVHFFDHVHFRGESFRLGGLCCSRAVDADNDLQRRRGPGPAGGWAEAISSVDLGHLVGVTLLFDKPDFRGDRLELWCDVRDLTRVPRYGHTGNWNDRACSAICTAPGIPRREVIARYAELM